MNMFHSYVGIAIAMSWAPPQFLMVNIQYQPLNYGDWGMVQMTLRKSNMSIFITPGDTWFITPISRMVIG